MQIVSAILMIAFLGIASIPVVNSIESGQPSPTPVVTASPTPTPVPTSKPNAVSTTLPENGSFEMRSGNSSIKVGNNNGSTSVNVFVEGSGEASVDVKSRTNSKNSNYYYSSTTINASSE